MIACVSPEVKVAIAKLRRYAFCLFGSLGHADAAVEECLRRVDPGALEAGDDIEIDLFRAFGRIAAGHAAPEWLSNSRSIDEEALHGAVLRLPLAERQALTLNEVCHFTPSETARILGIDEARVESLVAGAYGLLASPGLSALIIEDEPLLAQNISEIVSRLGIRVVGMAINEKEAIFKAAETKPGLILADVRLTQGSGLNAISTIRRFHAPRVAYLTAFPSEVLRASGQSEALIVAKPFKEGAVEAAVRQLAGMTAAA
ncbi:response regulator [Afifella sp. IM 167]|uniref:response regulator n=1 Tax=Afifella sp. IM 167 TaxID=2033586 RepID=UPI001CCA9484|nr:response regulator [Afifella sp. IM 167]MBZ8132747.1 hypothetical protein [Afifella sp. IM 167]